MTKSPAEIRALLRDAVATKVLTQGGFRENKGIFIARTPRGQEAKRISGLIHNLLLKTG
ncbi:MAG: hypothetical protein IPJ07_07225 [Acidobacteria bacterium]|nr:hypothetical protein [Acidobacteriota bacterium]